MPGAQFDHGQKGLRIAQLCQICNKKMWTNQKPSLEVTQQWGQWQGVA